MTVRVQVEDFSLQREYEEVLAEAGDAGAVLVAGGGEGAWRAADGFLYSR